MYIIKHMQVGSGFFQCLRGLFQFFQDLSLAFGQAKKAAAINVQNPCDQEAVRRFYFDD